VPLVCKRWDAVTAGSVQLWRRFDLRWRCDMHKIAAFEQWVARRPHLRPRALAARLVVESATADARAFNHIIFRDAVLPVVLALGRELCSLELELDLEVGAIRPPWVSQLPALSSLVVRCRSVDVPPSFARASCLTELRIYAAGVSLRPGCIPPTLRELRLAHCAPPAGRCALWAGLPPSLAAAAALTALHLEAVTTDTWVIWAEAVAPLWAMTQLRRLHYPRTGDVAASPGVSCLTALTRLALRADPAHDVHGPAFAAFSTLQQLRVLDLADCMVQVLDCGDLLCIPGVEQLVLSDNPDLRFGDVGGNAPDLVLALHTVELDVRAAAVQHPLPFVCMFVYPCDLRAIRFTAGGASPATPDANALLRLLRDVVLWSSWGPRPPAARRARRLVHFDEGAIEAVGGLGTEAAGAVVELARVARVVFGAAAESEVPWVRQV
jgi:hypothetical protein